MSYAVSLLKQLLENVKLSEKRFDLVNEKDDLIKYLQKKISTLSKQNILPVESTPEMWGGSEQISFRCVMWSKRLEILSNLHIIVHEYKK